jgi:uncharacterized repeat protein (TIGR01451 family)
MVNDLVRVVGLVSEDGDGHRIRVRNHGMHPEYPDDVEVLPNVSISKSAEVPGIINPGVVVTYTVELTNSGDTAAVGVVMTDSLPAGITFGGWVMQNGAVVSNNVITWAGDLHVDIQFVFTATVDYDASMYGQTITNSAEYSSDNTGSGSDSVGFELGTPVLVIEKSVATTHDPAEPLDPITYTLVVSNDGTTGAAGVHIWDMLPDYVMGEDVDITVDIEAGTAYTITIPASLAPEVPLGTTITNSAQFQNGGLSGEARASFNVLGGEPSLSIEKTVETANDPALPGDPITYTVVVRNDGTLEAENVHIWDALPDYVLGDDFDISTTIEAGTAYTITIPAQVALDAPVGVTVVNTAHIQWQEVSDEASASFTVSMARKIYLPYIMK